MLELIYLKTVPPEYREKPFKSDRLIVNKVFDFASDRFMAYVIARDHIDSIFSLILKINYLIVKENCERMTRFVDILLISLRRQSNEKDNNLIVKLFCHLYKMSEYIYYERSAFISSVEGIEQNLSENFTNTH